ncbi:polysaccharide biosynthesis/export family protein [Flavihumibacter sediminis]|nr:polysaccharide biosynthesis/export family protein [Flavihumibacter sediminis]
MLTYRTLNFIFFIVLSLLIGSCASVKKAKEDLVYLKQGSLDSVPNLSIPLKEAVIQKDDILSITVFSDNAEATALFNQAQSSPSRSGGSEAASGGKSSGYLVDQRGNIRFQTLGIIHVEGLTRLQLMDTIAQRLLPYLQNPYADVRFINARVTVLGEVQKPGVFNLPDDKISILELMGMAGDVTIYGRKENVLVIREENGRRNFARLDLRKADVFQNEFYYLQQNDIIVVEPSAKKPTATEQDNMRKLTLLTAFATFVSTISILITLF